MPRGDTTGPDGKGPKTVDQGIPKRDGRGIGIGNKPRGGFGGGIGRGGRGIGRGTGRGGRGR